MELLDGLLADAGLLLPGVSASQAVAQHRQHQAAGYAALIGPLIVPDDRLVEVGRAAGSEPIAVRVLVGGGAGGLLALGRRAVAGIDVVGAVSALRDLSDLAGNAARVVAAAADLDEAVEVFVELPYAPGWPAAAELVEAAGLSAQVRGGDSSAAMIEQLVTLIEIDLPFSVAGQYHLQLAGLLLAVDALVETGDAGPATALLTGEDRQDLASVLRGLSGKRIRRRLLSVDCPDPAGTATQLGAALSESGPADRPPDTPRH